MAKKETKEDKYVTVYSPVGICSYPNLHAPYRNPKKPTEPGKYGVDLYIPKEVFIKEGKDFVAGVLKIAKRYNPEWKTLDDFKHPICDCDKEIKKSEIQEYQKGMIRVRAGSNEEDKNGQKLQPPIVIGPHKVDDKFPIFDMEQIKAIKGGDYGRIICNPYGWTFMGKSGVSLGLAFFQFAKPGKPIGQGRMKAIEKLDEISVEVDSPDEMIDKENDSEDNDSNEVDPMLSFA